jgi:hypothetical protein
MAVATGSREANADSEPPPAAGRRSRGALLDRNVFVVCVLAACCAAQAEFVRGTVASDSWYSLLGGRIVAHSGLPHTDTLTVMTLGLSWVDQQWLAHLGLYALWSAGGWRLTGVVAILLYLAAFTVTATAARRRGASDRSVAIILAFGYLTGLANTVIRAQIWTYLVFALLLALLLADARRPSRRVFLVFPLLVLWANLHGSVVVGAALVSLSGLTLIVTGVRTRSSHGALWWRAGALVVLPWPCILVSPYGLALPGYYRSVLDNPTLSQSVSEWAGTTLRGNPVFFVALLGGLWLATRSRTALTLFEQLALWLAALLGLLAVRNVVWYALVAAAVLPAALDAAWSPSNAPRQKRLNLALAGGALAAAALSLAGLASHASSWWERSYSRAGLAAVAKAARQDPSLRVFANERYGDWLLFNDPALTGRVAYDIRFELLPTKTFKKIVTFRSEHGYDWQAVTRGYGLLVLDPAGDRGAVTLFEKMPGTKVLYRDRNIVVLRRSRS